MMESEKTTAEGFDRHRQIFIDKMDDDLNTADAITAIFELVSDINHAIKDGCSGEFAEVALAALQEPADVLGLLQDRQGAGSGIGADIEALVEERQEARKRKDFARADRIRDQLAARGITLKDTPQGVQIIEN